MNEKQMNLAVATAALRLSVIQPAFNGTFPDRNKQDYYIRIAEKPLKLPDGREVRYAPSTFSCWESDYRRGGFDALMPKQRSDKGHSRKLDADVIAGIYSLREKFPKLTATGICRTSRYTLCLASPFRHFIPIPLDISGFYLHNKKAASD